MGKNGDKKQAAPSKIDPKSKDIKKPKASPVKAQAAKNGASKSVEEEKHDGKIVQQPKQMWDFFELDTKYKQ